MAKLSDLNLSNDQIGGDLDIADLPKVGGMRPLVTPGSYRFKIPEKLGDVFDVVEAKDKGQRLVAIFDANAPLTIVQSPAGMHNGDPFQTRISNVERARKIRGTEIVVSEMDFLLKAIGYTGKKPKGNKEYAAALLQHGPGKEFGAVVEFQWYCNKNKNIWALDSEGNTQEIPDHLGCGSRYYQKDVDKLPDGKYPERITCGGDNCGASLRAMEQLQNIS